MRRFGPLPSRQFFVAYATGLDSVVPAHPEKRFDEQDGQSYCSDSDTRAQSLQRRRLPSVSPVKRRQVAVSESVFDGVERHSLFDSPTNHTCGLNVNDVLCVRSESLVTLVQECYSNVLYEFTGVNT